MIIRFFGAAGGWLKFFRFIYNCLNLFNYILLWIMGGKKGVDKHTTFMFKTSIKESFQDACFESGYSMTEVLEMMMVNFIATVKNKKDGKEKKD